MLVMERPAKTDTLPTRVSLLKRLKNLEDERSWKEFVSRYEEKVRGIARCRGLTAHDAEDVAQEVFKRVAKTIGNYQPAQRPGSFRSWLFKLTRWRATDQLRSSRSFQPSLLSCQSSSEWDSRDRTPVAERVPAPAEAERAFEEESRRHLVDSLLKRVERTVSPKQLQVFQMLVLDEVPAAKVAELYGMTATAVYVIKHRVMAKLRAEMAEMGCPPL
jgi:RNA polymerase sigma-70 factor, ECF subfamily